MKFTVLFAVAAIATLGSTEMVQEARGAISLVSNGGFELPVVGGNFQNFPPPLLTDWTITSAPGSGDLINSYWPAYEGSQSIDMDGTGQPLAISQVLATTPGAYYTLSFAYANNPDGSSRPGFPPSAQVTVTGSNQLLQVSFTHSTSTFSNMDWTVATYEFVADSASTTLEFKSLTPPGPDSSFGVALDAVSVIGTPEPASLAAWSLLGCCASVWSWRRKNRATAA